MLDDFGQYVQTVNAIYPKLAFNNRNISENRSPEHEIIISLDGKYTLHSFEKQKILGTTVEAGEFIYWDDESSDREVPIEENYYRMRRAYFHLEFQALHSKIQTKFDSVALRCIPHFDAFNSHEMQFVPTSFIKFWCRLDARDDRSPNRLGFNTLVGHTINTIPRWVIPYFGVPYFFGVPWDKCTEARGIDNPLVLAGWLEDLAEDTFDRIKYDAYMTGVRLLQGAITHTGSMGDCSPEVKQ